jgi:hypothetical protein
MVYQVPDLPSSIRPRLLFPKKIPFWRSNVLYHRITLEFDRLEVYVDEAFSRHAQFLFLWLSALSSERTQTLTDE